MNIINEFRKLNLNQILKLSIITGTLLVGFSIFYYYVIILPPTKMITTKLSVQEEEKNECRKWQEEIKSFVQKGSDISLNEWQVKFCKHYGIDLETIIPITKVVDTNLEKEECLQWQKQYEDYAKNVNPFVLVDPNHSSQCNKYGIDMLENVPYVEIDPSKLKYAQ